MKIKRQETLFDLLCKRKQIKMKGVDILKKKQIAGKLIRYSLLIFFSIIFIMPIIWMVSTSLKAPGEIFSIPPEWIPNPIVWGNYKDAIESFPFLRYTMNSVIISGISVIGGVLSASLVAYSFAKLNWPGKNIWFIVLIATMMLPPQVTMIPLFIFYSRLGLIDSFIPLILPNILGNAYYIFLIRQFYMSIPKELNEAARIDGASEFYIWRKIFLPLSKPVLATCAIFLFMFTWNDFLGPLVYLHDPNMFTLQLGLRSFQQQFGTRWNVMMAASLIVASPSILLFAFFQKHFIKGSAASGIKG